MNTQILIFDKIFLDDLKLNLEPESDTSIKKLKELCEEWMERFVITDIDVMKAEVSEYYKNNNSLPSFGALTKQFGRYGCHAIKNKYNAPQGDSAFLEFLKDTLKDLENKEDLIDDYLKNIYEPYIIDFHSKYKIFPSTTTLESLYHRDTLALINTAKAEYLINQVQKNINTPEKDSILAKLKEMREQCNHLINGSEYNAE